MKNYRISTLISRYRSMSNHSADREFLFQEIVSEVREMFYFMPQEEFGMNEEDCAEFLLQYEKRIPGIIAAYNEAYDDFEAFLYPTIEKCVRGFRKNKECQTRKEKSLLICHSGYEYMLSEMENPTEEIAVSEAMKEYNQEENIALQRLKYIFAKAPYARKRFYVFFFSYAAQMTPDEILDYCTTFNFSYQETMRILSVATELGSSKKDGLQHAIEKRNEYYGKKMYYENELAILNFLADHTKDRDYWSEINKYDNYSQLQKVSIQRFYRRMSRSELCRVFHKVDGTIANYLFVTKNLVEWCINPDFIPREPSASLGVSEAILRASMDEKNIWSIKKSETPLLRPMKYFNLHLSLN